MALFGAGGGQGRGVGAAGRRLKRLAPLLAAPLALLLAPGDAKAVLNFNIFQRGQDVVLRASGSLVLPGAYSSGSICATNGSFYNGVPFLAPGLYISGFCSGPLASGYISYDLQGPPGGVGPQINLQADSSTGLGVGLATFNGFFSPKFVADSSYAGGSIASESVFLNKNLFTDFGISSSGLVSTYTLLSNGNDGYTANDTINLIVGAPVPGPLPLFGAGAAFGWSRKLRRRIGSRASVKPQV